MSDGVDVFAQQSLEIDYAWRDGRLDEWVAERLEREREQHGDLERELEWGRAIVSGGTDDVEGENPAVSDAAEAGA